MWKRRSWQGVALTVATLLSGSLAAAEPSSPEPSSEDRALATVLFNQGRALVAAGQISEACLKFEESQRLDPSGGTILNLALCDEMLGKLARSWSEFNEATAAARREGRQDRLDEATKHAHALEPRLSRLTIVVPESARLDGLRVERDGRELGQGAWSTAMPVDGGEHEVRATAPGKTPFYARAAVAGEGDAVTVTIPALASQPTPVISPASSPPPAVTLAPGPQRSDIRRPLGWTLGAAGLMQLGVAGYFGLRAFDLHAGNDDLSAGRAADRSTWLSITGLVTTAVGVALLLISRHS
jgi:hypothetical protein